MWVVDYLHNRSGEGIVKRDNHYYLKRLRDLRVSVRGAGVISSPPAV